VNGATTTAMPAMLARHTAHTGRCCAVSVVAAVAPGSELPCPRAAEAVVAKLAFDAE
jgi:hypothetical protein